MAATERGQSQGAVSQQLRKLETALGVQLIERSIQGCKPTAEGTEFIDYAESLIRLNARVIDVFRRRSIVIGASSNIGTYLLQPYIRTYFRSETGRPSPQLHIHQNPVIAQKLDACEIDVATMEWWDGRPGYIARPWRREELVAVVPPGHIWSRLPRIPYAALKNTPLLGGEPGTGTGRILARHLGETTAGLNINMQLGSTEAVKQWIKANLGVSVMLAGTVKDECQAGTLVAIPIGEESPAKELYVIWRASLSADHPARLFGEWLAANSAESVLPH